MTKKIAIDASVDIGNNITGLIEQLAKQIGTTADKVFPWYVQQSIIEGYMFLIIAFTCFVIGWMLIFTCWKKSDFNGEGNSYTVPAAIGLIVTISSACALAFGSTWAITSITNPKYYAMQAMIHDFGRLLGK